MLTVIVPIYGAEKYLREALDSLAKQELKEAEFLLICDGSIDHSPKISKEYADKDPRFRVILKNNEGYGMTCNLGIEEARGDYIAIFEPDDYLSPQIYKTLYTMAKEQEVDIVCSNFVRVEEHSLSVNPGFLRYVSDYETHNYIRGIRPISKKLFYGESSSQRLCFNVFEIFRAQSAIWAKIFRKSFLQDKNIKFMTTPGATFQDFPFYVETFTKARNILFCNESFYYYRVHNHNSIWKVFKGPYRYIHLDIFSYLIDTKKLFESVPEYAKPSYYRAFLWQYFWALKNSRSLFTIWSYCGKMSEWTFSHPWIVDTSFTLEERQLLTIYKKGNSISRFFYTIKAIIFRFRPHSFLASFISFLQKILVFLRIIQKI